MTDDTVTESPAEAPVMQSFTCQRPGCGFVYQREKDFEPYMCYKCMRFVAKSMFRIFYQIHPQEKTNAE
jgi:hypothetical protein